MMCWHPNCSKGFQAKSFYSILRPARPACFSWKSGWKAKVTPRVAFFAWILVLGKILTADNMRRHGTVMISWCYLCLVQGGRIGGASSPFLSLCLGALRFSLVVVWPSLDNASKPFSPFFLAGLEAWDDVSDLTVYSSLHYLVFLMWVKCNALCELWEQYEEHKIHSFHCLLNWMSIIGRNSLSCTFDVIDVGCFWAESLSSVLCIRFVVLLFIVTS